MEVQYCFDYSSAASVHRHLHKKRHLNVQKHVREAHNKEQTFTFKCTTCLVIFSNTKSVGKHAEKCEEASNADTNLPEETLHTVTLSGENAIHLPPPPPAQALARSIYQHKCFTCTKKIEGWPLTTGAAARPVEFPLKCMMK